MDTDHTKVGIDIETFSHEQEIISLAIRQSLMNIQIGMMKMLSNYLSMEKVKVTGIIILVTAAIHLYFYMHYLLPTIPT